MINKKSCTAESLGITSENILNKENLRFYDVKAIETFRLYGLWNARIEPRFMRMPACVADYVNDGVKGLNYQTAGGRIRFVTTSRYIAIKTTNRGPACMTNMDILGSSCFDVYMRVNGRETFVGVLRPSVSSWENGYDAILNLPEGTKELTVNFPLYHGVTDLYIGLDKTSSLTKHPDYAFEKPVLYYGSSITQGGCASRPGMCYEAIISRRLDTNYRNLGFSGSARAEDIMIDYLSTQDCSVFVLDYDHNAPNAQHLANTHEKLYLAFRKTHPETPVIMVGKPDFWLTSGRDPLDRREVIYNTYWNAKQRGEKVIFIDGYSLFHGDLREECTVDGCHPNDLGMSRMADVIGKAVEDALGGRL